jgi:hypothetical protein
MRSKNNIGSIVGSRNPDAILDTDINLLSVKFLKRIENCGISYDEVKDFFERSWGSNALVLIWNTREPGFKMNEETFIKYSRIAEASGRSVPYNLNKAINPKNHFKVYLNFKSVPEKNKPISRVVQLVVEMEPKSNHPQYKIPEDVTGMEYIEVRGKGFTAFDKIKLGTFLASFEKNSAIKNLLKEHLVIF